MQSVRRDYRNQFVCLGVPGGKSHRQKAGGAAEILGGERPSRKRSRNPEREWGRWSEITWGKVRSEEEKEAKGEGTSPEEIGWRIQLLVRKLKGSAREGKKDIESLLRTTITLTLTIC